jgi:N-acetylmuramoyl-L-alanine amidase
MRKINYIVVHCTATPQNTTVDSIKNYWTNVLGWKSYGYHYLIDAKGIVYAITPEDKISNGVKGYNKNSIHVSYIGGKTKDDRTIEQKNRLISILTSLKNKYPNAKILGHRDFPNVNKACPQFDAIKEYQNI